MSILDEIWRGHKIPKSKWKAVWSELVDGTWNEGEWMSDGTGWDEDLELFVSWQDWTKDGRTLRTIYGENEEGKIDDDDGFWNHLIAIIEVSQ